MTWTFLMLHYIVMIVWCGIYRQNIWIIHKPSLRHTQGQLRVCRAGLYTWTQILNRPISCFFNLYNIPVKLYHRTHVLSEKLQLRVCQAGLYTHVQKYSIARFLFFKSVISPQICTIIHMYWVRSRAVATFLGNRFGIPRTTPSAPPHV